MKIGLTYDLRQDYLAAGYTAEETAEFDRPETIAGIESALQGLGCQTERIGNGKKLIERLVGGDRWDLVFNIAEGLHGTAREAQVPAILDLFGIPYTFSDPLSLTLSLHKNLAKTIVRQAGVPTPDFFLVERPEDADKIDLPLPLFVKPAAEGTSKGISAASKILDRNVLRPACEDLLGKFQQPVLVERFLPGREFTVGLSGTGEQAEVLGTMEVILQPHAEAEVYSYRNKEEYEDLVHYKLVRAADDAPVRSGEAIALTVWRTLGCRDAGRVDLRCDEQGEPNFIEVNPLPGLHPQHSDLPILCALLGIPYTSLIERIVQSARQRIGGGVQGSGSRTYESRCPT